MDKEKQEITRIICGAFNEWADRYFSEGGKDEIEDAGRKLMGISENRDNIMNILWTAFFGGFEQGMVFGSAISNTEMGQGAEQKDE
jgi:hypothetical protein